MKTLIRTLALVVLSAAAASAQDITGTWQGTLQAGRDLRTVFRITTADGGLRAVMFSIDQSPQGIAVSSLSVEGSTVRMTITPIGGAFEGRLSADGTSIEGTFSQGGGSLPLTLRKATPETAWALPEAPKAMAANASPGFEVATIKPSAPDTPGKLLTMRGRTFMTVNTTLNDLITMAYDVHVRQIVGGAPWMETDKYDITGQPDVEGLPNQQQVKTMLQKLLTDRFRLTFHRDKQELPAYAIKTGNTAHKLAKSAGDPNGLPSLLFKGLGVLPAVNASMADLARVMQIAVLDRPVVDQTGIQGRFDFLLQWTPDESQFASFGPVPRPAPGPNAPPGLFTAIQEQLGLRMESTRAPVDVLVIDRVEKPSEN